MSNTYRVRKPLASTSGLIILLSVSGLAFAQIGGLAINPQTQICNGKTAGLDFTVASPQPPRSYDLPATTNNCVDAAEFNPGNSQCVRVSNTPELVAIAATESSALTIVLEDGLYTVEGLQAPWAEFAELANAVGESDAEILQQFRFLRFGAGHKLWAENSGGAILQFGIDAGGNASRFANPEFHGLTFNIPETLNGVINEINTYSDDTDGIGANPVRPDDIQIVDRHARTIALSLWEAAQNAKIEDVKIIGNGKIQRGIQAAQGSSADGLKIRRVTVSGLSRFGIFAGFCNYNFIDNVRQKFCNEDDVAIPMILEDISVSKIGGLFDPGNIGETDHIGIVLGARGRLSRAKITDVTRVAIGTLGTMRYGLIEDIQIDRVGIEPVGLHKGEPLMCGRGIYLDNATRDTTVRRFCIGTEVEIGVNSEWDNCRPQVNQGPANEDPSATLNTGSCFPRGINNMVEHGFIAAHFAGIGFDQGTRHGVIQNNVITNARQAGIIVFNNFNTTVSNNTWLGQGPDPVLGFITHKVWNTGLKVRPCSLELPIGIAPNN